MSLVVSCNRAYDIANQFLLFSDYNSDYFIKINYIIRKYYIVAETIFETDYVSGL